MPRKSNGPVGHTGQTDAGHTRDVKVERIGPVTIYKRGSTYSLYYREGGVSHRRTVDGNLAVARATALKVASAKADGRPSPLGYRRTTPEQLVSGFLDYITNVQGLALTTQACIALAQRPVPCNLGRPAVEFLALMSDD